MRKFLVLVMFLALAISGCSTAGGAGEDVQLRLGYFPNVTHAPAIVGVEEGIFAEALGANVDARDPDLQRRPRGHRGALRRRARRQLHRSQPGDQRLRQVERRGACGSSPGSTSGGAVLVVQRRRSTTPDDLAGKTLATPQLGNTQDVALRAWLEQGLDDRHRGRRRRLDRARRRTRHLERVQGRRDRRRLGARSPGPPGSSQEGGGKVLVDEARPLARRRVRDDPPHRARPSSSRTTPTSSRSCSTVTSRPSNFVNDDAGRGPGKSSTPASRRSPASALADGRHRRRRGRTSRSRSTRSPSSLAEVGDDAVGARPPRARSTSRASTT